MKKLIVFSILLMTSWSGFSQGLTPQRVQDSLICFNSAQGKQIAKLITLGAYCDSISKVRETIIAQKDSVIGFQDSVLQTTNQKADNLETILQNKNQEIGALNKLNNHHQKQIKKLKRKQGLTVGTGLLLVFGVLLIK